MSTLSGTIGRIEFHEFAACDYNLGRAILIICIVAIQDITIRSRIL